MEPAIFVLGGTLWINLLNTVCMHNKLPADLLSHPATALPWLEANGLVPAGDAPLSEETWSQLSTELVSLRNLFEEALYELGQHGPLSDRLFDSIARRTDALSVRVKLTRTETGAALAYEGKTVVDDVLYRILRSFTDTLELGSIDRIRKCEHEECILRFIDTSKSGKRRWCSMELCGNRHKAAEFYAKKKLSKAIR
ncbi:zf-CGNR multi-domain protein [Paenibacillus sp. H1-7]|uniref:CGNR zinc finger domain-containing protein n=1 Tax=Paenibacillus sp. H1-7 TaxID=2282849 RepID=UPI001EF882BE|nr:CGNR zinc finger domain-containing protein [Paenibacillus sp. H1-7]ULL13098.1 zf-CGNR multi-domain protein [Paenibacillus sp. H1-7]